MSALHLYPTLSDRRWVRSLRPYFSQYLDLMALHSITLYPYISGTNVVWDVGWNMGRQNNRLSALTVSKAKKPGMYPDGGGLYLRIAEDGGRGWFYRFTLNGRQRYMGLGSLSVVTLAEAREKAQAARRLKSRGIDPIEQKASQTAADRAEQAKSLTFKEAAGAYIRSHKAGWRNEKHADQWENTLTAYAYPVMGSLPVDKIETAHVLKVIEPIWTVKTETASRVRGRIESVLDWAAARGHRSGVNPARWRGHLSNLLPARSKVQKVQHHPALSFAKAGDFMAKLRKQESSAAMALELLILTATRTNEVIGARWEEIDLKANVWTIPADRMKASKEHRVPLSAPAVTLLKRLLKGRQTAPDGQPSPWVFPGVKGKHLSNGAILALLARMGREDITAHGFRSTFRDWAAEQTAFPRDVVEMALAHTITDKVEAAYRRGDLFKKREKLMDAWAGYVGRPSVAGNVTPIRQQA